MYASEIQSLYADVASHSTIAEQTEEPLSEYLRNLLAQLAGLPIPEVTDETSLYDLGIDSHLALSFRHSISAKLKTRISLGAIFENPTISQLSAFLQPRLASQRNPSTKPSTTRMVNRMISKLESEFQRWAPRATAAYPRTKGETVLLTGPTGSLGTALLESLSKSPKVCKIYAMLRGPNHLSRLRSALEAKSIDLSILEEKKVSVLNFSMQDPLLGLDIDSYHHLTRTVTTVIQNAWEMDFNKCVEEFESDCIRSKRVCRPSSLIHLTAIGTVSLLRFCYAGRPKRLAFTSSTSTCMGPGHISRHVSEAPIGPDPSIALSTGYAQSKYIIERITQTASLPQGLNIPVKLLRVGQLCGSTKTGKWNTNEMFPIMFVTSAHEKVRAIPVMPIFPGKLVDWIPVDVAAEAISEVLFPDPGSTNSHVGGYDVHNIVNPVSIPWPMLVEMIQSSSMVSGGKPLEEVSMTEWVQRLEILADEGADANDIPGLKLLAFWENMAKDKSESKIFETGKTRELSRSLSSLEGFRKEWLEGNLRAWREEGFLTTIEAEPRKVSDSSEL
jgi:thioester reductase-like protein/acyl carrier protein